MKKQRIIFYCIIAVFVVIILSSRKFSISEKKTTLTGYFDTVCDITVYAKTQKPIKDCTSYIKKMHTELSPTDAAAAIYKLNNGDESLALSKDAAELVEFGKKFGEDNPDLFSIYLNPLIEAWDIKNNTGTIPDVSEALNKSKQKKQINLGATAKGYVTDKLVRILQNDGVKSGMINLGGNAYAIGKKPTGEYWKVGIQSPKDENSLIGVISAENLAVVTSGDYERFFDLDGIRYHHILDPKTGYPSQSGLHSVTIISDNALLCDALSTAIFVAGKDKGEQLLKKYNVRGIFVSDDTVYFSKELENIFKQTDFSYKYEFMY